MSTNIPQKTLLEELDLKWQQVTVHKDNGSGQKTDVPLEELLNDQMPVEASAKLQWSMQRLVKTADFLKASRGIVTILGALNSTALDKSVKSDIVTNVGKLQERFDAHQSTSQTIQELCLNEIKENNKGKKPKATEGFVWLARTLNFLAQAFQRSVENKDEQLSASFQQAYRTTLKPLHDWFAQSAANLAWGYTPTREKLYSTLALNTEFKKDAKATTAMITAAENENMSKVDKQLFDYVTSMNKMVDILRAFIEAEPTMPEGLRSLNEKK